MKQKETMLNTLVKNENISLNDLNADEIGNNHIMTSIETPMKSDAFKLSDDEKMKKIEATTKAWAAPTFVVTKPEIRRVK